MEIQEIRMTEEEHMKEFKGVEVTFEKPRKIIVEFKTGEKEVFEEVLEVHYFERYGIKKVAIEGKECGYCYYAEEIKCINLNTGE